MYTIQKQSSERVLRKRCPQKFREIQTKTSVPDPKNFVRFQASYSKETPANVFFMSFAKFSKNTFFVEHQGKTVSAKCFSS